MENTMKYHEFKESLKKKAKNLKDIKIGLKEAQRTLFFNSFDREGNHHGYVGYHTKHLFTDEQLRRHKMAYDAYERCVKSYWAAYRDYRARHIAISLFRGRTPEQIENNYNEWKGGKWNYYPHRLQEDIDKHLNQLRLDNPPETYYNRFDDEGNFIKEAV
jgi:hypothetical protein